MTDFINYIESNCSKLKKGRMAYLYKRKLLDEMTARAQEIAHAGITDEKVIRDLITDELGDLSSGYASFEKEEKTKRFHKKLPLIGIISPRSDSSPANAHSLNASDKSNCPDALSNPKNIGKSKTDPSFLTFAGARLTVILLAGKRKPEFL